VFGLGSDPIIGLGNIAFPVNQNWFSSLVLSKDQSGTVDGPLAFGYGTVGGNCLVRSTQRIRNRAFDCRQLANHADDLAIVRFARSTPYGSSFPAMLRCSLF